ncbi:DUF4169 family protein [Sphingobium sp. CR28]|uniref:DUF4169 family protein n=1 Tax=Sphingobium sp. CR28 TaxID=3400272 RepID=UPI003FED6BE4
MGEIINLRQARKRQARAARETEADANRLKFGRTKGERLADAAQSERAHKKLAGHKIDKSDD